MSLTPGPFPTTLDAGRMLRRREISSAELTDACLALIAARDADLGAFITVTAEEARAAAAAADRELASGEDRGPLHGIPVALKDLFDQSGVATTAGSVLFKHNIAASDAAVTTRLRAAGAVFVGKTNLHEWAFGVTTDNPHFGPARNPYAPDRIPGGSSGGSAVALATGMCFASVGSDTGGSIRIPASLCGIVGLKPTSGRVSLRGAVPLSWTLDHAGPMARTVRDVAVTFAAIAGFDPRDPASVDRPIDAYLGELERGVDGLRIGLAVPYFFEQAEPEVIAAVRAAADALASVGARLTEVTLPRTDELRVTQRTILGSDAAAFHRERLASRRDDFGRDVAARIDAGLAVTGAEYAAARRTRDELIRSFDLMFDTLDLLALPTTPTVAPLREGADAVAAAARLTGLTSPFNLTGLPAISIPCGRDAHGLPIGLQLVSRRWGEALLLRAANTYERVSAARPRGA
ncbi:MAG TPA: amidase [Candidatus Saccharimonadales bacterium]|nr:amidase [Candidatus Saccharimonadales bacterium]